MFIINATFQLYILFFIGMKLLKVYERSLKSSNKPYRYLIKTIAFIYVVIFVVLDVLYDITIGSILFSRLPEWSERDKTFTARLKHMKKNEYGWRYDLAVDFCNLLNKADKGHC